MSGSNNEFFCCSKRPRCSFLFSQCFLTPVPFHGSIHLFTSTIVEVELNFFPKLAGHLSALDRELDTLVDNGLRWDHIFTTRYSLTFRAQFLRTDSSSQKISTAPLWLQKLPRYSFKRIVFRLRRPELSFKTSMLQWLAFYGAILCQLE